MCILFIIYFADSNVFGYVRRILFHLITKVKVKVKVKFTLEQATKAQRWSKGIALLFLEPRRWMGVDGQRHAPAALPPEKTLYPLYRRLGGPQGRSEQGRKIRPHRVSIPGQSSP